MINLKVLENGLIPVYSNEKGKAVNARELHEFLEVGKDFTTWIKERIQKYGFIENEDFLVFTENGENLTGGRPKTEYILTMDTAKEIAMVQNNEKGSQARKYFISVEKKFKEVAADPYKGLSKELQAIFLVDKKTQEMDSRITKLENTMTIDYAQQEELNCLAKKVVVQALGGYGTPAYKELNKKAFSAIWKDYKRVMQVNSYKNTAVKEFVKGKDFISNWVPGRELELMIKGANSQVNYEEVI